MKRYKSRGAATHTHTRIHTRSVVHEPPLCMRWFWNCLCSVVFPSQGIPPRCPLIMNGVSWWLDSAEQKWSHTGMLVAAFTVATAFAGRTASTDSFHMDGQKPACHYLFSRPQLVCVCCCCCCCSATKCLVLESDLRVGERRENEEKRRRKERERERESVREEGGRERMRSVLTFQVICQ